MSLPRGTPLDELRAIYALLLAKAKRGQLTPTERTVRERVCKLIRSLEVSRGR